MPTFLNETIFHPMFVVTVLVNLHAIVAFMMALEMIHSDVEDNANMTLSDRMLALLFAPLTLVRYFCKVGRALEARRQARAERQRRQAEMDTMVQNYLATGRI